MAEYMAVGWQRIIAITLPVVTLMLSACSSKPDQLFFTAHILPTPVGMVHHGEGLNEAGDVVGYYQRDTDDGKAFVWKKGETAVRDIEGLGGKWTVAKDINDAGVIVGSAEQEKGGVRACIWEDIMKPQDISMYVGPVSEAYALNSSPVVIGQGERSNGEKYAFTYNHDDGVKFLKSLGGRFTTANSINKRGTVVGQSGTEERGGNLLAVIWDVTGEIHELIPQHDTSEWMSGCGSSINERGIVVGNFCARPVIFGTTNDPHYLNTLGGIGGDALAINDMGIIVGWSETGGGIVRIVLEDYLGIDGLTPPFFRGKQERRATLWRDGVVVDLNNCVKSITGAERFKTKGTSDEFLDNPIVTGDLVLSQAKDINNQGQILCEGVFREAMGCVLLLSPVPPLP